MQGMTQPAKGVVATALVVTVALLFCALISPDLLGSWGTSLPVAMEPAQMVLTLFWRGVGVVDQRLCVGLRDVPVVLQLQLFAGGAVLPR